MVLFGAAIDAKLGFILGVTNILGLLLVFFSCRCLVGAGFVKRMLQHRWYRRFYKLHCYYWWLFIVSVAAHAVFTLSLYGVPF
jgi:hypothetical protein